jgi:hypothetical protein
MAWSTPPTFSDGSTLSATQLNTLSDDLSFLYGVLKAPQMTFPSHFFNRDLASDNNGWTIRYYHRYIHYRIRITSNSISSVKMYVNGTEYVISSTEQTVGHVYSSYVDVNAQGLTVGEFYTVYFVIDLGGLSSAIVEYVIQSEATSL